MPKKKQYNTRRLYFSNRIIAALNEIFNYPLTIIEAPMGYGKTTAIRNFLNDPDVDVNILWQSIYDNSLAGFWNNFAKQFYFLDSKRSQSLSQFGFPNDNLSIEEALQLIEDIQFSDKTVLVIDDYHLINNSSVNQFIERLAKRKIDNFYIVVTARFVKFEKLEELLLKKYLYHIKKEIFELTPKEIKGYFKICGFTLSDYEAQELYSDTEGWISALYLFMLEYETKGSYTPADSIFKLLEKSVYICLTEEMREFLMTLCIFDCFTLKQAEYMWEKKNAAEFLAKLIDNNLFATYDTKIKTYNIHSIFLELLKEKLGAKEISYRYKLYKKAAEYFMESGDWFAARRYFYECGDFDGILSALEEDKSKDYSIENKELLKRYINECPKEIKSRHHYALLIYAMQLFIHKEIELFKIICDELNENIENDEGLDNEKRNRLLGELEFLLSFSEFNDLKKMSQRHQKAWQLLKQPTSVYYTRNKWTFGIPSVLSLYYRESGMLKEHIQDLKEGLAYYYRLTKGHGSGGEYAMEAESCFNQGDFENAEILAQKALLKAQLRTDESVAFSAQYFQVLIAFMRGDLSRVMKLINKMHADMNDKKDCYYIHMVEICEACIYAYLDQVDRIPERLLKADLGSPRVIFPAYPFFNIAYGRMLLIKEEYLKLIGCAEHFIAITSVFHNLLGYIYTYIYLAAAYRKIYRDDEALDNLKKALDIAMPDKQYMIFVENCDYIEPILDKIYMEGNYQEEIKKIFELYKIFKKYKDAMICEYFAEEKPKLTQRELEIAQLAAEGKTNKEIGKQLFISANTVKMALKSVYSKLNINNRALLKQHLEIESNKKV